MSTLWAMQMWVRDLLARDKDNPFLREPAERLEEAISYLNGEKWASVFDSAEKGLRLARQLSASQYQLIFLHLKSIARSALGDNRDGIDDALSALALVQRHPDYPLGICAARDFVAAHQAADGPGHARQLLPILEWMEHEMEERSHCRLCVDSLWIKYLFDTDQLDSAAQRISARLRKLSRTFEARRSESLQCYLMLSRIALRQSNWQKLAKHSAQAKQASVNSDNVAAGLEAELLTAITLLKKGRNSEAQRSVQRVADRAREIRLFLPESFYEVLAKYYELVLDFDHSIAVRTEQLLAISGQNLLGLECVCLVEIARLKYFAGKNAEVETAKAREFAFTLINPEVYLRRIENRDI